MCDSERLFFTFGFLRGQRVRDVVRVEIDLWNLKLQSLVFELRRSKLRFTLMIGCPSLYQARLKWKGCV